jgi:hypothetical protein
MGSRVRNGDIQTGFQAVEQLDKTQLVVIRIQTAQIDGIGQLDIRMTGNRQTRLLISYNLYTTDDAAEKIPQGEMLPDGEVKTGAEILAKLESFHHVFPDLPGIIPTFLIGPQRLIGLQQYRITPLQKRYVFRIVVPDLLFEPAADTHSPGLLFAVDKMYGHLLFEGARIIYFEYAPIPFFKLVQWHNIDAVSKGQQRFVKLQRAVIPVDEYGVKA